MFFFINSMYPIIVVIDRNSYVSETNRINNETNLLMVFSFQAVDSMCVFVSSSHDGTRLPPLPERNQFDIIHIQCRAA